MRLVRGMFKTLRLCLEARLGREIPVAHPVTSWLVRHACLILNTRARGGDGKTPWERIKGRPFGQKMVGIFEKVLYKF